MKPLSTFVLSAIIATGLAACDKAEPPKEVSKDVSAAQEKAVENSIEARKDAVHDNAEVQKDVAAEQQDRNETVAEGAHDVAVTDAKGEHKIAIEKCEAFSGDQQAACKKRADEALDSAKDAADAQENAVTH
jgi:hypothetical protein